jgi:MFS family permease
MQRVAVGWLAWDLTHSGTWLGIVVFADLFPTVLFGPIGGVVADRMSPLTIARLTQAAAMLMAGALWALTFAGAIDIYSLTALVFAQGAALGFGQPARLALVYQLVSREHLSSAVAFNSVYFNLARFIGPMLAGAALVWNGAATAFGLNALSYIAFIVALMTIKLTPAEPTKAGRGQAKKTMWAEVSEGARYALGHARIGPLLILATLLSITVRPYAELLPGFADRVFHGGAAELAMMSSAVGLGAMIAGLRIANRAGSDLKLESVFVSAGVASIAVLGFALTDHFPLALALLMVAGGGMVTTGVTVQTSMQLAVDTEFRARVMSLYGLMQRSGPASGALLMGVAADWFGLSLPVAVGASLALLFGARYWYRQMSR